MIEGSIPVSISLSTLVVELLIFLLMVYLMERLVFNPIRTAWAERDRRIQEGLAAATISREEAEAGRDEVRRILAEARLQAQHSIDAATARGDQIRDDLVAEATAEFRKLVDAAQGDISAQRERTAEELQGRIIDLSLLAASQVTGESYSQPRVRELAAAVVSREGLG
jgi:F-type H+-transporting ATPase subunit b